MQLARTMAEDGPVAVVATSRGWTPVAEVLPGLRDPGDNADVLERRKELAQAIDEPGAWPTFPPDVELLAPLARPGKLIGIGLNYSSHAREVGLDQLTVPVTFAKFSTSIQAPRGTIPWRPDITSQLDYEVELAVVIGDRCRDVSQADALEHVGGYAVANDVSARDRQFSEGQWVRSKSFDGFCPLGPWITTADEITDPQRLRLMTRVNGELRQDGSTADMSFSVAALISFLSQGLTLEPGDVILTGSPPGVAMGLPDPPWLKAGDVVECAIERLGTLEHVVANAASTTPTPDVAVLGTGAGTAIHEGQLGLH